MQTFDFDIFFEIDHIKIFHTLSYHKCIENLIPFKDPKITSSNFFERVKISERVFPSKDFQKSNRRSCSFAVIACLEHRRTMEK